MAECLEQQAQVVQSLEEHDSHGKLLDRIHDIIQHMNTGRQQSDEHRASHHYGESDDDISSDESGDDEENVQQESVEDIQAEMQRLELSEEASTLETLILIVEHYIKTDASEGFRKNMRRPDMWLMTTPRPKAADVASMADNFSKQGLFFRAVLMYKCLCAIYKYDYIHHVSDDVTLDNITPDDAIRGIEFSMQKVYEIFHDILHKEECNMYLPYFIPVMYDMLTNLREIHHSDRKMKANLEAWCMLYISVVHGRRHQIQEMQDVAQTTSKTMERRFKKKVWKYQVYGANIAALSVASYLLQSFTKAEQAAKDAEMSVQNAEDLDWDCKVELVEKMRKLGDDIQRKI